MPGDVNTNAKGLSNGQLRGLIERLQELTAISQAPDAIQESIRAVEVCMQRRGMAKAKAKVKVNAVNVFKHAGDPDTLDTEDAAEHAATVQTKLTSGKTVVKRARPAGQSHESLFGQRTRRTSITPGSAGDPGSVPDYWGQ
jgi:hypothetical protein